MKDFNFLQAVIVVVLIALGITGGIMLDRKIEEKKQKTVAA